MKIAFLITNITTGGGIERVTSNLSDQFVKAQQDVTIISCFKDQDRTVFPINEKVNVDVLIPHTYSSEFNPLQRVSFVVKAVKALRSYLRKGKFDIIIAQAFLPAFLLYLNRDVVKSPVIICEHFKYNLYGKMVTKIRNHVYRKTGKVITLTENDEKKYRNVGIDAETIPNMISFPVEEHTFEGHRLISVGRLHPQKGFDMLIQACKEVFNRHPDWQLDIFGEGEERDRLQQMINSSSLDKNIFLKGYSRDIRSELSNSDICVVSSRYEGFSMSITESMALGTPVVSFDCPEGPSVLLADGAGILVPAEDVEALSKGICDMIESPNMREESRRKGFENIAKFSPEPITNTWMRLFDRLLSSN